MLGGYNRDQFNTQYRQRRAPNSNLHVDRVPKNETSRKSDFKGGDYVDFEEVK